MKFLCLCIGLLAVGTPSIESQTRKPERPIICIDPGHPSEISDGFQRLNGTSETHENWVVAQRLKEILVERGFRVIMTKSREKQVVTNVARAGIANKNHVLLMLRLHCDTGSGTGYRVFYPDTQAKDGKVTGPPIQVQRASKVAADALHSGLLEKLADSLKDNGIKSDRSTAVGTKMGGALVGSIHSKVPVTLVEMVFLNNPKDAAFIKSEAGKEKMAQGLAEGVRRFVERDASRP